jgi:hypothetical protein
MDIISDILSSHGIRHSVYLSLESEYQILMRGKLIFESSSILLSVPKRTGLHKQQRASKQMGRRHRVVAPY